MASDLDTAGSPSSPQSSTASARPSGPKSAKPAFDGGFAFLNHSQETFPNNLPPTVDNQSLARQRRRRTSPEDQAILEAEFRRDPKPNKASRNRIVGRVTLGDREVQIWFQNRRQNSRRKSQPLTRTDRHDQSPSLTASPSDASQDQASSESLIGNAMNSDCSPASPSLEDSFSSSISGQPLSSSPELSDHPSGSESGLGIELVDPPSSSQTTGPAESAPEAEEIKQAPGSGRVLRRTASSVRVSLASDGSARLLGADEASPSPPRTQPLPPLPYTNSRGRRRSYSDAGFDRENIFSNRPSLKKVPSGRSRDSRAWEFWCDSESRSELAKKAEQENSGSASEAIRFIRTTSRGPLTPNLSRANSTLRSETFRRGSTHESKKPRREFVRTQSSIARISCEKGKARTSFIARNERKPGKFEIFSGDSDKENQDPESEGNEAGTRAPERSPTAVRPKGVLTASNLDPSSNTLLQASSSLSSSSSRRKGIKLHQRAALRPAQDSLNPEADEEVAAFMRSGGRGAQDLPGEDDLDCIQGLLSLSQGNWR